MTTWTDVADPTANYAPAPDVSNGYVVVDYLLGDYIAPEAIWSDVADVATVWV